MLTVAVPLASTVGLASAVLLVAAARRWGVARAGFLATVMAILLLPGFVLALRATDWVASWGPVAWGTVATGLTVGVAAWGMLAFVAVLAAMAFAPRLRPPWWNALVTVPGTVWAAGTFLAIPWVVVTAIVSPWMTVPAAAWIFYGVALTGVWTSFVAPRELVRIDLRPPASAVDLVRTSLYRARVGTLPTTSTHPERPLRLVQITDPHLGPFRSEASLRALAERAVAADPDLLLLTGDFFTVEGAGSPDALGRALAPLRPLTGRTFACLGNHDHESPEAVRRGLAEAGVTLLVDEARTVATPAGLVQIVGLEHRWRGRDRHARVLQGFPRPDGALRLVLLHDPGAFEELPEGEADLVLSGHTHGGHVGLVSLGLTWTAIRAMTGMPDHGLWQRGRDRLYVHRGSGHYGFPLRIGVPLEESVIEVLGGWIRR